MSDFGPSLLPDRKLTSSQTYEGGYGQTPNGEALGRRDELLCRMNFNLTYRPGGTSYCAIAALYLAPDTPASLRASRLTGAQRLRTVRWLVQNQTEIGGFSGRTGKPADACYCFWCGAGLSVRASLMLPPNFTDART